MNTLTKIFVAFALVLAIGVVAVYIMGQIPATQHIAETITGFVAQAKTYVTDNLPTVFAAGGLVTTIGGAALSKVNAAKEQVSTITAQKDAIVSQASAEKDSLTATVKDAQTRAESAETEVLNLKEQYANFDTVLEGKNLEIERLKSQIDGLSKQNVDKLAEEVSKATSKLNQVS